MSFQIDMNGGAKSVTERARYRRTPGSGRQAAEIRQAEKQAEGAQR